MKLHEAEERARELLDLLRPACERIEIAGSIRRGCERVGDIELVAVARWVTDRDPDSLFGGERRRSALELLIRKLLAIDLPFGFDQHTKRNGPRYKRMVWRGLACDLFIVEPHAFGLQLAIRTGPADFSKLLVTPRSHGGAKPDEFQLDHGVVYEVRQGDRRVLPFHDEAALFAAFGVPEWRPADRSALALARALRRRSRVESRESRARRSANVLRHSM